MNKTLHIQNSTIFYRVYGNGIPILLIHGFAEDGNIWQKQINFLKDQYTLIVPDLPGSGRSPVIDREWSIEDLADVIKKIADEEKLFPVGADPQTGIILIGHSMGGYITLAFAEKYPQYVKAFGFIHSSSFADNEEKKQTRLRGIEFIEQHGANAFLQQTIPNLFTNDFKKEHGADVENLLKAANAFTNESLIMYYSAMMQRPDRTQVLKQSVKPVMLIIGEEDKAVSLADSLRQCSFAEQSLIKILPNAAHMGMLEATDECNKTIVQFIDLVKQF